MTQVSKKNVKLTSESEIKRQAINSFLEYTSKIKNKKIVYKDFNSTIDYLNYLNFRSDNSKDFDRTLKHIIVTEVWKLEKIELGLGDKLFENIISFFKKDEEKMSSSFNIREVNDYILDKYKNYDSLMRVKKDDLDILLSKINSRKCKKICEDILDIISPEDVVFLERSSREKSFIKRTNNLTFDLQFDIDFIRNSGMWSSKNFKFLIIDGFIQSVGEIHHLLQQASEDKEDYVIFCKGMEKDVKSTIILNNKRKTINVMIVSLEINEENVNILNDIAVCLKSDIVSALKGDTISNAVKNNLNVGKGITIQENKIIIENISEKLLTKHKSFLKKKLLTFQKSDPNYIHLKKRIKNLNNQKLSIFLNNKFTQDEKNTIDGFLKFIKNSKSGIIKHEEDIININSFKYMIESLKSIIKIIKNTGPVLTFEEEKK